MAQNNIKIKKGKKMNFTKEEYELVLNSGRNGMRIPFLLGSVDSQLSEIRSDKRFYSFCQIESGIKYNTSINDVLEWIIFMDNDTIRKSYNKQFNKNFWDTNPESDILDLFCQLKYWVLNGEEVGSYKENKHLLEEIEKINNISLNGFISKHRELSS